MGERIFAVERGRGGEGVWGGVASASEKTDDLGIMSGSGSGCKIS